MNLHERLKLLSLFHYVLAGVTGLFGCFPLVHVAGGVLILTGAAGGGANPPPEWFGLFFLASGAAMSVSMWLLSAAAAAVGYYLRTQRYWTFCLVVAAVECLNMPFGTILGVFTIVTLVDPQAKEMFARSSPAAPDETRS